MSSGVDISIFKLHSTHSASAHKAATAAVLVADTVIFSTEEQPVFHQVLSEIHPGTLLFIHINSVQQEDESRNINAVLTLVIIPRYCAHSFLTGD